MSDSEMSRFAEWRGHEVVDGEDTKVGKVEDLYLDEETGRPEWLSVKTGLFGSKHSFVPLVGARAEGQVVVVAYPKDKIVGSPPAEHEDGFLTPEEEAKLYTYYGVGERAEPPQASEVIGGAPDTSVLLIGGENHGAHVTREPTGPRLRRLDPNRPND